MFFGLKDFPRYFQCRDSIQHHVASSPLPIHAALMDFDALGDVRILELRVEFPSSLSGEIENIPDRHQLVGRSAAAAIAKSTFCARWYATPLKPAIQAVHIQLARFCKASSSKGIECPMPTEIPTARFQAKRLPRCSDRESGPISFSVSTKLDRLTNAEARTCYLFTLCAGTIPGVFNWIV